MNFVIKQIKLSSILFFCMKVVVFSLFSSMKKLIPVNLFLSIIFNLEVGVRSILSIRIGSFGVSKIDLGLGLIGVCVSLHGDISNFDNISASPDQIFQGLNNTWNRDVMHIWELLIFHQHLELCYCPQLCTFECKLDLKRELDSSPTPVVSKPATKNTKAFAANMSSVNNSENFSSSFNFTKSAIKSLREFSPCLCCFIVVSSRSSKKSYMLLGIPRILNTSKSRPKPSSLVKFSKVDRSLGIRISRPVRRNSESGFDNVLQSRPKAHRPIVSVLSIRRAVHTFMSPNMDLSLAAEKVGLNLALMAFH
ncbi:hypothetical protein AGLY_006872 [Aphis glycines]|uniref:Uncharacterized protein n=1 Tax=Aphis glycines TaxID=307491 RepID=A0A6G0TQF6_APHGL|nr:hypothetical protein AGLY_006872 [Aphis glycines]